MDANQAAETIRAALLTAMDAEEFDVTVGDAGEIDISTDDWTLHFDNWPDGPGWLAIDEEPEDPAAYAEARRAVMSADVERALAAADRDLNGTLSRALAASDDPFTLDLIEAMRSAAAGD
ncbi:MAG TPA: hypothetical protein VIL01_04210 [Thermomicrobiales bacterium]